MTVKAASDQFRTNPLAIFILFTNERCGAILPKANIANRRIKYKYVYSKIWNNQKIGQMFYISHMTTS